MQKQMSHRMTDGHIRQISLSDRCLSQQESVIRQTETVTRHFPTAVEGHQSVDFCVGLCIRAVEAVMTMRTCKQSSCMCSSARMSDCTVTG